MNSLISLLVVVIGLCLGTSTAKAQAIGAACTPVGILNVQPNEILYCNASNVWAIGEEILSNGNVGIGTTTPGALLDVGSPGTILGVMRLEGNTSGYVALSASAAAGSWTMTLPTSGGTNGYVLTTNGSGVTSWASATSGATVINLGTSATVTNPQRSGDATTGLFSAAVGTVSVASAGTDVADFTTAGEYIAPLGAGLAMNSTAYGQQNVVWIPPVAADPSNFSLAIGQNTIPSDSHSVTDIYSDGDNGEYNTAVGQEALYDNTGGAYNTAVGAAALQQNTIGEANTAVGYNSLNANTTGAGNVAMGYNAMSSNTTGINNTALGNYALYTNTTGTVNTAVGSGALGSNAGSSNTAVGAGAAQSNTTGQSNTALGNYALYANTTGSNNTVLGDGVGNTTLNGGSSNILIGTGSAVDVPTATTSNFLNIGNTIFATGMTGTLSSPAGNVGIGTAAPAYNLDLFGNARIYSTIAGSPTFLIYNQSHDAMLTLQFNSTPYSLGVEGGTGRFEISGSTVGLSASTFFTLDGSGNETIAGGLSVGSIGATVPTGGAIISGSVGIANTSPGALLDIGKAGTTLGTLRLEGSTSGYVQLQTNVAAGSWTMTLPTSAGTSGYVLSTDGTGITSWVSASSGAINLGTSATATSPQRSGQAGTGLFSAASNTVSIAASGGDVADFTAAGEYIVPLGVTCPLESLPVEAGVLS